MNCLCRRLRRRHGFDEDASLVTSNSDNPLGGFCRSCWVFIASDWGCFDNNVYDRVPGVFKTISKCLRRLEALTNCWLQRENIVWAEFLKRSRTVPERLGGGWMEIKLNSLRFYARMPPIDEHVFQLFVASVRSERPSNALTLEILCNVITTCNPLGIRALYPVIVRKRNRRTV